MLVEPPASICPESNSRTGHSLGMDWTKASTPSVPTLGIEAVPLPPPTFQKLPLSGPSVPSTSSLGQGPVIRQMLMTLGLKGEGAGAWITLLHKDLSVSKETSGCN